MLKRAIRGFLVAVLVLLGGLGSVCAQAPTFPINLVHQAMDQVLVETGNPFLRIIKQGSWITGGDAYRNPLVMLSGASDHDARLFISLDDLPPEQARATWLSFKRKLQGRVMALARTAGVSPEHTQLLLRSINLYPPAQVFKDIANNEQALAAFWRSGNYPNLLEVGEEGAEGLYTKATKFIRQRYEMGSRVSVSALVAEEGDDVLRLVHRSNANLEHMIEGVAAEGLEGYVQATEYTMQEAQKALRQGNLDAARKNLKRMEEYHKSARRLGGVKVDSSLQQELERLKAQVDELASRAFSETAEGQALLAETRKMRTAALSKYANVELAALEGLSGRTAVRQRAFYKGLLEGEGKWVNFRQELELASERVIVAEASAARLVMKHWITGLFALWELKALPEAVQKEGAAKATARMAMTIASLASVHVAIADIAARAYMWVGELLVDFVSSYGYEAAISRQDCNDLIAGLYMVDGRQANVVDKSSCEPVPSDRHLACRVYDHHGLRKHLGAGRAFRVELMPPLLGSLLTCHATAASKKYDDMESRHDGSIVKALVNKCLTPLTKVWLDSRQLVVSEIDAIRQSIEERPLRVQANPARLPGRGVVRFSAVETMNMAAAEKDIASRAACLGGTHAEPRFLHSHLWTVNGQQFANSYDRPNAELNLTAAGNYEVCVTQQSDWRVAGLPSNAFEDGLQGRAVRRGCTQVTVDEPQDTLQAPVQPLSPTSRPPLPTAQAPTCAYDYSDWGECSRASKKQTRNVRSAKPIGCVERAKPVLEQACTPPPSDDDKRNGYLNCLCRCSSGWAGHIGVWYDPEQKTVPECKSSGPCIGGIGAFGCSRRHFFNSSNECAKGCWEGAYGKGSFDPERAARISKEENRKYKVPLAVKLKASKNPAEFGDIVALTAEASDGAGGYQYNWGGCAQDAKDATAKVVNTRTCRACQASVSVTDADGDTASDSLTLQCSALRVKLTKESPRDNRIPVGGKATFLAEVFSGDKPAAGNFSYIWERNPDAVFGDPRNPSYETRGGAQSRNSAVFGRPGTIPVWVSVQKEVDGRRTTMGESEQILMEVVRPRLTLSAEPREVTVGQEIRLTVQEEPKMGDEMLSYWWEIAGDAGNAGPVPNVPNSRAYSFRPKSERPITVTVHAKARDGGDEIGVERLTVQARRSVVSVAGPKIAGPTPMVWKEGVGLVPAGQQIAEGQRVEFAASVAPDPRQDLRYVWTVTPEGCYLTAPASRETGVTCSRAGGYNVVVAVRTAEGADLGNGSASLSVTLTSVEVNKGKQKDEANKKLEQAKQLWTQGKYDEALALLDAATAIDKALAAPVAQQARQALKKLGADALQQGDAASAIKRLEQALRLDANDAEARQKLQQARALDEKQRQGLAMVEAARANLARGQPADAKALAALAEELKKVEALFAVADARRKPVTELLAAVLKRLAQPGAKG